MFAHEKKNYLKIEFSGVSYERGSSSYMYIYIFRCTTRYTYKILGMC